MPSVQNGVEVLEKFFLDYSLSLTLCFFLLGYITVSAWLHSTFSGTLYPQTALLHASLGQITQWASVPAVGTVGMHELALGLAWQQMECEGHL